jgi:colanic acid/amylovoran biosynthesis glycosyltransferase
MTPHERQFFNGALEAERPNIVHVHHVVDACYFGPVLRRFLVPVVVEGHGYDTSSFAKKFAGLGRWYLRPAWSLGDLFLAMSRDMAADMAGLGCPAEKIRIYYRGINLQRFPYIPRRLDTAKTRVLFVGRLDDERKGVEFLLQGFAQLAIARPEVELRIVGAGRFQDRYAQLARTLGINHCTEFAGFVPHQELAKEYGAAHIFCHPSVTSSDGAKEGIPGTVVEAMATGLPIVTTLHAGIPEMVTDGEHGFVVPERDITAIGQALRRLVEHPELRLTFGANAAQQAKERGDAARQATVLEHIYDELLNARTGLVSEADAEQVDTLSYRNRSHTATRVLP